MRLGKGGGRQNQACGTRRDRKEIQKAKRMNRNVEQSGVGEWGKETTRKSQRPEM